MSEIERLQGGLAEVYSRVSDSEAHALLINNLSKLRSRLRNETSYGPVFWEPVGFFGNSKYLFLAWDEYSQKSGRPRPIWLTTELETQTRLNEQGLEAILWMNSQTELEAVQKLLAGSSLFCSSTDYLPPLGAGLIYEIFRGKPIFQMWHGIATKDNLARWNQMDLTTLLASLNVLTKPSHLILPKRVPDLEAFFGYPRMVKEVSPRNWPLLGGLKELSLTTSTELIVYAPTFSSAKDETLQVEIALSLSALAGLRGWRFETKPHPNHGPAFTETLLQHGLKPFDKHSDLQTLLAEATLLVTDVSSASIDFLLRDKPIVFTLWDDLEIVRQNIGILRSRDIPALNSFSRDDLRSVIEAALENDQLGAERRAASRRYHGTKRASPEKLIRRIRFEILRHLVLQAFTKS